MKCEFKNYLFIYNIKLIELNTNLKNDNNFQIFFFVLLVIKKLFLLTQPNMLFIF